MRESLIRAHSQRYSRGKTPDFSHDRHQLILVSNGALVVANQDAQWVTPAQHCAWIPAKTRCSLEPSGQTNASALYVRADLLRAPHAACTVLSVLPLLRAIVDHLVALESLPADQAGRRLASVLVDQITTARRVNLCLPAPKHPRAVQAAALLIADPSDTVSLAAIGQGLSSSARTLARQFVSDTGVTFGQWRQQFRLTHALMLVARGRAVKDVALEVGYESPSAFVAAFKRALGTTPGKLFKSGTRNH